MPTTNKTPENVAFSTQLPCYRPQNAPQTLLSCRITTQFGPRTQEPKGNLYSIPHSTCNSHLTFHAQEVACQNAKCYGLLQFVCARLQCTIDSSQSPTDHGSTIHPSDFPLITPLGASDNIIHSCGSRIVSSSPCNNLYLSSSSVYACACGCSCCWRCCCSSGVNFPQAVVWNS